LKKAARCDILRVGPSRVIDLVSRREDWQSSVIEKYEARRIKQEISQILWEVWDPIGVNSSPEARDEYDSYVNPIYVILTNGSTDKEIASYLLEVVTEGMGLLGTKLEDMPPTIKALRNIQISEGKA
jgi:hypothetical protein